jgi:hypothetical protein
MEGLTNPFLQQTHYQQTSRTGKQTQQYNPPEEHEGINNEEDKNHKRS